MTHHVTEVFNLRLAEDTLLPINGDPIGNQQAEDLPQVVKMSLLVGACNEDIIQIDEGTIYLPQNAVHQTLKSLSSVLKSEWHPNELE